MLLTRSEVSPDQQLAMVFNGQIALDPDSGAYVYYSRGRSRYGAESKYTLVYFLAGERKVHHFRAGRDSEALEHARAFLGKRVAA